MPDTAKWLWYPRGSGRGWGRPADRRERTSRISSSLSSRTRWHRRISPIAAGASSACSRVLVHARGQVRLCGEGYSRMSALTVPKSSEDGARARHGRTAASASAIVCSHACRTQTDRPARGPHSLRPWTRRLHAVRACACVRTQARTGTRAHRPACMAGAACLLERLQLARLRCKQQRLHERHHRRMRCTRLSGSRRRPRL